MARPLPPAARERLAARARRVTTIRRRVIASTVATFALAWGVIAFAGPMGTSNSTAAATTTTATTTSDDHGTTSSWDESPAAVTTSQS
jgi:hypothetical protein